MGIKIKNVKLEPRNENEFKNKVFKYMIVKETARGVLEVVEAEYLDEEELKEMEKTTGEKIKYGKP